MYRNIGANFYAQAGTLVLQIAGAPLLISRWGLELYGLYIMCIAAGAYLSQADLGVFTVLGNRVVLRAAKGFNRPAILRLKVLVFAHWILCGFALLIVVTGGVFATALEMISIQAVIISGGAALGAVVGLGATVQEYGYRAHGQYARGVVVSSSLRISEGITIISAAGVLRAGPAAAVLAGVLVKFVLLLLVQMRLQNLAPGSVNRSVSVRRKMLLAVMLRTRTVKSGIMMCTYGFAANLQNHIPVAALASYQSASAVAIYSVCRTYSRVILQLINVFVASRTPKVVLSSVNGGIQKVLDELRPFSRNLAYALVVLSVLAALMGPLVVHRWIGGSIEASPALIACLILQAALAAFWLPVKMIAQTLNRHIVLAKWFLAITCAYGILTLALTDILGVAGVAAAGCLAELIMIAVARRIVFNSR